MRGPSLRIRIHYARKQTPAGVLGRRLSGGREAPGSGKVQPNNRPRLYRIAQSSKRRGLSTVANQATRTVDVLTRSPYSAAFRTILLERERASPFFETSTL